MRMLWNVKKRNETVLFKEKSVVISPDYYYFFMGGGMERGERAELGNFCVALSLAKNKIQVGA